MGKEDMDTVLEKLRKIPEDCKDKCAPDAIKDNYRYCIDNCAVLTEDLNNIVDSLQKARDWIQEICTKYNLDPTYVYELDDYLNQLAKVSTGDLILPEHHNRVVDTLFKIRDVLEKIEGLVYNSGYQEGYQEGYNEGYSEGQQSGYQECVEYYGIKINVSYKHNRYDVKVDANTDLNIKTSVSYQIT